MLFRSLKLRILEIFVKVGDDGIILDSYAGCGIKINVAKDAGKAHKVLIFVIAAVAPAVNLNCQQIFLAVLIQIWLIS